MWLTFAHLWSLQKMRKKIKNLLLLFGLKASGTCVHGNETILCFGAGPDRGSSSPERAEAQRASCAVVWLCSTSLGLTAPEAWWQLAAGGKCGGCGTHDLPGRYRLWGEDFEAPLLDQALYLLLNQRAQAPLHASAAMLSPQLLDCTPLNETQWAPPSCFGQLCGSSVDKRSAKGARLLYSRDVGVWWMWGTIGWLTHLLYKKLMIQSATGN